MYRHTARFTMIKNDIYCYCRFYVNTGTSSAMLNQLYITNRTNGGWFNDRALRVALF